MNAKSKKKLSLSHETVRLLTDREVQAAAGGASIKCTGTEACSLSCPWECTGGSCFC